MAVSFRSKNVNERIFLRRMQTGKPDNRRLGRYVVTSHGPEAESVRAFVPLSLPPVPPVHLGGMQLLLEQASQALGRLDGLSLSLPDPSLFLYFYLRKEAVLSSQIEGTQSSLSDFLLFENDGTAGFPTDDFREELNYVAAMNHGLERLSGGFPISGRLIREIHEILLSKGRGSGMKPGEFRTSQNWIGGSRPGNAHYVPPPPGEVAACMSDLERFIHEKRPDLPLLVKAALVHVQFESIHPFLDGNGRLGRLLITFMLAAESVLSQPLLYLSLYLKTNRSQYYELLNRVRSHGDWEAWLDFFLRGVKEVAEQACEMARKIQQLHASDRQKIEQLGRPAASALRVYLHLQQRPVLLVSRTAKAIGISAPTVTKSLEHLRQLDIVKEITGRQRDRIFRYETYVAILNEGTEIEKVGRAGEI